MPPRHLGDRCYIQNQAGNYPRRWDRSGTVVEDHGNHNYTVKVDGSGRLTRRGRKHLRQFSPARLSPADNTSPTLPAPIQTPSIKPSTPLTLLGSLRRSPSSPAPGLLTQPGDTIDSPQVATPVLPSQEINDAPTSSVAHPDDVGPPPYVGTAPGENHVDLGGATPTPIRHSSRNTRRPKTYEPETGQWI